MRPSSLVLFWLAALKRLGPLEEAMEGGVP